MIYRSLIFRKKNRFLKRLSLDAVALLLLVSLVLLAINFGQIFFAQAAGASLYLTPSSGTYAMGDEITISLKAFTDGKAVNASEGLINFDKNLLEVTSLSKSGSIFTMWTTEPTYSNANGTINYGGGVPAPGFASPSAGKVLTIAFRAKAVGAAQLRFSSGALLASDGKGSNILETLGSANFTITPKSSVVNETPSQSPSQLVNIGTDQPTKTVTPTDEYLKPTIVSNTNPDQNAWSKNSHVEFKWDIPTNVVGANYAFNKEANFKLEDKDAGLITYKAYNDVTDGSWYMHVKFFDGKKWGATDHYRVLIDTVKPKPFDVQVEQKDTGNWPTLSFKSSDDTSGVANYEIYVNSLEEEEYDVPEDAAKNKLSVQLAQLTYGDHTALVKVTDKAGNETDSTIKFHVEPIQTPIVKDYAKEIRPSDKFYISGVGLENTLINLYIQDEQGKVLTKSVKSDASGNWLYLSEETFKNGRHVAWVEAENANGLRSKPSEKISFLVSPPVFAVLGSFVINYFSVIASLIFMILLIIALGYYLAQLIRKKLKKETVEVEVVLKENMAGLRTVLDDEMKKIGKLKRSAAVAKEDNKMKELLSHYIEATEKKILREIKDVENILH